MASRISGEQLGPMALLVVRLGSLFVSRCKRDTAESINELAAITTTSNFGDRLGVAAATTHQEELDGAVNI